MTESVLFNGDLVSVNSGGEVDVYAQGAAYNLKTGEAFIRDSNGDIHYYGGKVMGCKKKGKPKGK